MGSLLGFIRWALIGSIAMGSLAGVGLFSFFHRGPASEGTGLANLLTLVATLFFAAVGFVLGGIYGVVRARSAPLLRVIVWALCGAVLGGVLTPEIFVWMKAWWSGVEVLLVGAGGAMFGFVLGSVYGIVRASRPTPARNAGHHRA